MQKTDTEIHAFITARVVSRLSRPGLRRSEALREVIKITVPGLDEGGINALVAQTPEIPQGLYAKWADMFAARLLETVPREQLEDLCANTEESNATLLLLYSMFMESERMESIVRADIDALNNPDEASMSMRGATSPSTRTQ